MNILITGGTGSLGTALCERYAENPPNKLIVLSRDPHKQDDLARKLGHPDFIRWFIGDVTDIDRLERAFEGVDVVIHAAAMKDIAACYRNRIEAKKINTDGTQNVIEASLRHNVKKVLFISTDKAAAAQTLYGKTKAAAEDLIIGGNSYSGQKPTRFSAVRYGNVIGSRGSVVEVWRKQAVTGKITMTCPEMTRFWIQMNEAVSFVLKAVDLMRGGEIFVPKIPSLKIGDLAEVIAPGCEWIKTGVRPQEKLHEILITQEEGRTAYDIGWSYVILPEYRDWACEFEVSGEPIGRELTSINNELWMSKEEMGEVA